MGNKKVGFYTYTNSTKLFIILSLLFHTLLVS
nr:MAG TPA: hypothetical protein [Caudoviricetes sp.]